MPAIPLADPSLSVSDGASIAMRIVSIAMRIDPPSGEDGHVYMARVTMSGCPSG